MALDSTTWNVSAPSIWVSPLMATLIVPDRLPAGIVRTPPVETKSTFAVAASLPATGTPNSVITKSTSTSTKLSSVSVAVKTMFVVPVSPSMRLTSLINNSGVSVIMKGDRLLVRPVTTLLVVSMEVVRSTHSPSSSWNSLTFSSESKSPSS